MKKIAQQVSVYLVLIGMVFFLANCGLSKKAKKKKIDSLEKEAGMAMSALDFETAVAKYKEVMKLDPKKESARNNLAVLYARFLNRPDEAKKLWEDLLKDFPKNAAYINNLAGIYRFQKKYDKAIALYEKAKKLNKTYHMPYYNIGFIELERKNYKNAEKEFKTAFDLTKKDTTVIDYYAYSMILNGEFEKAKKFLEDEIKKFPKSTTIMVRYLRLLNRLGELDKIDSLLEKLEKEGHPDFLELAEKIEVAFKRKVTPEKLTKLLNDSVAEIKPDIAKWYKPLIEARINGIADKTEKAISDLKKLEGVIPKKQTYFQAVRCYAISQLYRISNNETEAEKWMNKAIDYAPEMYLTPENVELSDQSTRIENRIPSEKPEKTEKK